ncbi:MAG TPA: hypothetical protein VG318_16930 [Actinomycetota bacterium]|nr:hypothetical protein [Actinomycetota bacterium]
MTDPYIPRNPGDPITAEDWNALQVQVKEHISACVDAAKEEIRKSGVERADNSDKFATRSDTEWEQRLDERYAGKSHEHEGPSVYRRYIKRFEGKEGMREVFLEHGIGRFPLVDLYQLDTVTDVSPHESCKVLFYYGHADRDRYSLDVAYGRDEHQLGLRFEALLQELGVRYDGDDSISDVVQDMWTAFAKDPNDEIEHCQTDWIEGCCRENRTVDELKRADQWEDLYVAIKPRKCEYTCQVVATGAPEAQAMAPAAMERDEAYRKEMEMQRQQEAEVKDPEAARVEGEKSSQIQGWYPSRVSRNLIGVTHVNYDTIHLAMPDVSGVVDLMVLLRA